jgi:hypothetical protein
MRKIFRHYIIPFIPVIGFFIILFDNDFTYENAILNRKERPFVYFVSLIYQSASLISSITLFINYLLTS